MGSKTFVGCDWQPQDLAVGHVDDGLAGLGHAELALRRRQWAQLVETVEIGAGNAVRLAFVEVSAHAEKAIREGEQRLGLREHVEVERGLVQRPRLDAKAAMDDHGSTS
jgi:hypothetical protein